MKRTWVMTGLMLAALVAQAAPQPGSGRALQAATAWLRLVDSGRYAQSWKEAAPAFQRAVSESRWVRDVQAVRSPLGKLLHRSLRAARYTTQLPGAPDGRYWVIRENAEFAHKHASVGKPSSSRRQARAGRWQATLSGEPMV